MNLQTAHPRTTCSNERVVHEINGRTAGYDASVAGRSADVIDRQKSLRDRFPVAIIYALATTLLVLFLLTNSAVIPIKVFVFDLITVAAAAGSVALGFQQGFLQVVLGARPHPPS